MHRRTNVQTHDDRTEKLCLEMMTGESPPPPPLLCCGLHPQNNQPAVKSNKNGNNLRFFRVLNISTIICIE